MLHAAVVLAAAFAPAGDDWPRFRGPDGSAVAPDADPPLTWNGATGENIAWKTPLPGPGASSPVVWGDAVFLTCYTGYGTDAGGGFDTRPGGDESPADLVRHLIRLDRETGNIVWRSDVPSTADEAEYRGFIGEHGYATSTPCTDGQRVYVHFGKTGVLAFDYDGEELWRTSVGTESGPRGWGSGASPILHTATLPDGSTRDLLIVNACEEAQALIALDPADGSEVWRAEAKLIEQSWTTPIVRAAGPDSPHPGREELIFPLPDELWGLNPATGAVLWYASIPVDGSACTSPVAADGTAYIVGGRQGGGAAVKLGYGGDGGEVTGNALAWTTREGSYVPSPLLLGDGPDRRLFWVSDKGVAVSLNAATGETAFKSRLPEDGLTPSVSGRGRGGVSLYSSPVLVGRGDAARVVALTRAGDAFMIRPGGELVVDRVNSLGPDAGRCNATPAASGDALFLRTDRAAWCVRRTAAAASN